MTSNEPRGWTQADQDYSDELMRQQEQWRTESEALRGPSEPSEWHGWAAAYGEPEDELEAGS